MNIKSFKTSLILAVLLTAVTLSSLHIGFAQVRSSTNYQLQSDSINAGGGYSTSTSFIQESTVGEVGTGPSASTNFGVQAGYQQTLSTFLSISTTGDVLMDNDIFGLSGGESNGSTTVTVITDNPAGYQLTIEAENDPAMQNGVNSIADYDAGAEPDFSFVYASNEALLGLTPEGVDIVSDFLDNGSSCAVGSGNVSLACWEGLSTTALLVAEGSGANNPAGATTTLHFRVGVGGSAGVIAGVYIATTTVTALPL